MTEEKSKPLTYPTHKNRVLPEGFSTSKNFYASDLILQHYLNQYCSASGYAYMHDRLNRLGKQAATEMDEYSMNADKNPPKLTPRNAYGEDINEVTFHPHYWDLMRIAVQSEMFHVKWQPELKERYAAERHRLGFAAGYLYAMSESGQYCPLCMTDGVARLIQRYANEEDKARLLPRIATLNVDDLFTGAMFLTEKAGGSDVGANIVTARHFKDDLYVLSGEKWFCSNVNADLIFVLARTDTEVKGTKGLSIFLVEKYLPDGKRNPMRIIRLKDKLGVRSMASAECFLENTVGKLIGSEFDGFRIMADMINLSRLYNSVAAISGSRRAMIEAYQFVSQRISFKKEAIEHALIRTKLMELGAMQVANFYLTMRAIEALDKADNGDETEAHLLRLLTPMLKRTTAAESVYIVRESMELMGGLGYIEDTVMPKIMRDVMVLPIWEGAGNIMLLDMLRATFKSRGLDMMFVEISAAIAKNTKHSKILSREMMKLTAFEQLHFQERNTMEAASLPLFERLTLVYKFALLILRKDDYNHAWMDPAIGYFAELLQPSGEVFVQPPTREEVEGLMGWAFSTSTSN